jgi:hypothetical protein
MPRPWYEEEVNGIVIGAYCWPYEFWSKDGQHRIAHNGFENDEQAIAWFKENFPAEFSAGVEMRVFDQPENDV